MDSINASVNRIYYAEDFSKIQLKPSDRIGDIVDERTNRRGEKQYKIR